MLGDTPKLDCCRLLRIKPSVGKHDWCRSRKLNRGVMTRHGPRLARVKVTRLAGDTNYFSFSCPQRRILGRGGILPPRSGVHAVHNAEMETPLTGPPQATSYPPQAAFTRIPGRGNRRLPGSGVHAIHNAEITLSLTYPPQATSYRPRARFDVLFVTRHYVPGTTHHLAQPNEKPPALGRGR